MNLRFVLIATLFIPWFSLQPAHATFPGKSIAHWDTSQSQEIKDPDYDQLQTLMQEKKYPEAHALVLKKKAQYPLESTPPILEGLVLNEMGQYREALSAVLAGQQKDTRHPAIHFAFCQIYRNMGDPELSERGCQVAIELHRQNPDVYYEYARTLKTLGMMESAVRELETAAKLDPENAAIHYERGMGLYYLNQVPAAQQAFLDALKIDPSDLNSAYQLAYLYAAEKKTELAKKYIYQVLESRREHSRVDSAKILLDIVGKEAFDKLPLEIIPHQYHMSRSRTLYQEGNYGLSLLEIQTAARLAPKDIPTHEVLVGLASILARVDLTEKATQHYLELVKENKLSAAKAYQEMGDIRLMQGNLKEAHDFYEKAQVNGDPAGLAKTSLAEFPSAPYPEAPVSSMNQIFIQPSNAMNYKGEIFAHYGMNDRALAIYAMVLRMDPNHLNSLLNTATAHYKKENYTRAVSILKRLLITHPNHQHLLAHRLLLARAFVKNGNIEEGLKNIEATLQINPSAKEFIRKDAAFEALAGNKNFENLMK